MFDARTFPPSLDFARNTLLEHGAILKGDYMIHDTIYASKNENESIAQIFLRLREVPKNIWDEKPVVVAIKNTEIKHIGKQSIIPVKMEFDTKDEGLVYIEHNHLRDFEYNYEFDRTGEQWFLGDDVVDLEDIEGHPSIEFKSKTEEGLQKLLTLFGVASGEVIKGPSVVEIKRILGR